MSGQYKNDSNASTPTSVNMTTEQLHALVVDEDQRDEFGLCEFHNPYVQELYGNSREEYKLKMQLKEAYDKQEFLRKMRADIKREYLTRKKQIKHLQTSAAVDFRNAEFSLQEHYASAQQADQEKPRYHCGVRAVDIEAPLVSCVMLPQGGSIDLKSFNRPAAFEDLRKLHQDYYDSEMENAIEQVREKERREFLAEEQRQGAAAAAAAATDFNEWWNQTPPTPASHQIRGAFGGCYDECYPDGQDHDIREAQEAREAREHGSNGRWGIWEEDCFSMNGDDDDASSYDSSYCAEFGYYPREYNYEREIREAEEAAAAAAAAAAEAEAEAEAAEAEAAAAEQQNKRPSHLPGCSNPRCVSCCWDDDRGYNNTWSDAESEPEEEHNVMEIPDDCPPIHDEPTPASTGGSAANKAKKKSSSHNAAAAKARIDKQQKKKHQRHQQKFVPLQVTENTNRANEVTATLTANKLEINLPKKKLLNATREAKKRYNQKWNHVNAQNKQSAARGTRIANIPELRYPGDSDYSD